MPRDGVRMLVAPVGGELQHALASDLPEVLQPGDLLVINTSQTLPAALIGSTDEGESVAVHLSTVLPGGGRTPADALRSAVALWVVELRRPVPGGSKPSYLDRTAAVVTIAGGAKLQIVDSHPAGHANSRLWAAELTTPGPLGSWLAEHGVPIRYSHSNGGWPLATYLTEHGDTPGSAEMPSAGRPLTRSVLDRLRRRGVEIAPLVLHCGVSSLESHDPPYAEWYSVPSETAGAVNRARAEGRRVIAVGTTVVRALESSVDAAGDVRPGEAWTELVITPERGVSVVDGLLTGWHEPEASHLSMLAALAGRELLCDSYRAALEHGYRWHEFGDVHLLLPSLHLAPRLPRRSSRTQ